MWPNLPQIPNMVCCHSLLIILSASSMVTSGQPVEGQPTQSQSSTSVSSCFNWEGRKREREEKTKRKKHIQILFIPVALSPNSVLSMSCVPNAVFQSLVQNVIQMHLSSHHLLGNCTLHLMCTTINTQSEAM